MKHTLFFLLTSALVVTQFGCITSNDSPIQIISVKHPPTLGQPLTCTATDPSSGGALFSAAAAVSTDPKVQETFNQDFNRVFYIRSNLQEDTTQFNGKTFTGLGRNDFQIREMLYVYDTDTITIPGETTSFLFVIPAASEGACAGASPLGSGAIAAAVAAGGSIEVRAHIKFRGVFNSGSTGETNEIIYPTLVTP
jgi:hypothetical protein